MKYRMKPVSATFVLKQVFYTLLAYEFRYHSEMLYYNKIA